MIKMEDLEVNLSGIDATEESEDRSNQEAQESGQPELVTSELIDVEWEQIEQVFRATEVARQIEEQLARAFLQFEKFKSQLMGQLRETEAFAVQEGRALKESLNIDPNLLYELKLPNQEGEKAFFVRKDQ